MRTAFDPDGSEHGTHVAGIAAGLSGITGTSLGVTITGLSGVAPHAYLGSYRVLTTPTPSFGLDGNGPEIARAIDQAVADGMDVLNLSLGEPEVESANDLVARAIHGAARAGVVTVVAAGNSGDDLGGGSVSSPGSAPDAITVAATSVGRFVGVSLGVLGPGAVPGDLAAFGAASNDAGCRSRRPGSAGVPLVVRAPAAAGARARSCSCSSGRSARRPRAEAAIAPGSLGIVFAQREAGDPTAIDDSQQRSLTVSDLVGARLAQQAAAAGGELTLIGRRRETKQVSANSGVIASFSSRGPAPVLARAQARRLRARRRHRLADPRRLRHLVGHEHGLARGRRGSRAAAPAPSGLDARADQVGARADRRGPSSTTRAHKHPTSVLAAGGGMIDVQAADAPGLFAEPSGVSFGLVRPGARRDALDRAQRRRRRWRHLDRERTGPRRGAERRRARRAAR